MDEQQQRELSEFEQAVAAESDAGFCPSFITDAWEAAAQVDDWLVYSLLFAMMRLTASLPPVVAEALWIDITLKLQNPAEPASPPMARHVPEYGQLARRVEQRYAAGATKRGPMVVGRVRKAPRPRRSRGCAGRRQGSRRTSHTASRGSPSDQSDPGHGGDPDHEVVVGRGAVS